MFEAKKIVYKVLEEKDGELLSPLCPPPLQISYIKGKIYNTVFAFTTPRAAQLFINDLGKPNLSIWKARTRDAFKPLAVLAPECIACLGFKGYILWTQHHTNPYKLGKLIQEICQENRRPDCCWQTQVVVPGTGTVVCFGFQLEERIPPNA